MIYGCIFLAYYSVVGLLFASARKWGIDGFRKITLLESGPAALCTNNLLALSDLPPLCVCSPPAHVSTPAASFHHLATTSATRNARSAQNPAQSGRPAITATLCVCAQATPVAATVAMHCDAAPRGRARASGALAAVEGTLRRGPTGRSPHACACPRSPPAWPCPASPTSAPGVRDRVHIREFWTRRGQALALLGN
jgi:hypothetical protein